MRRKTTNNYSIDAFTSNNRRQISSTRKISAIVEPIYSRIELDTHADSIVAGANCCIMHYTSRECDVSPYRDDYSPIKNVPIVQAATTYQSPHTGQNYILILNEALWMGDSMQHTLINPNQLRHYGITVQDNPASNEPMYIIANDADFNLELKIKGTNIFADTHTPTDDELRTCPRVTLSSPHPWNPHTVKFNPSTRTFQEEMMLHH